MGQERFERITDSLALLYVAAFVPDNAGR